MIVLHVTESYGGGVTSAIKEYVRNSDYIDHYMFAMSRAQDSTGEENNIHFKKCKIVSRSLKSIFLLYSFVSEVSPDFIHVHSTYAGFFVRLLFIFSKKRIIYTPHGYCFLRKGSRLKNKIYYFIEKILSFNTYMIAACSIDEKIRSSKFYSKKIDYIPNISGDIIADVENIKDPFPNQNKIVMLGRISAQKDFIFFSKVAEGNNKYKYIWIGGGRAEDENYLKDKGIFVTGWISRSKALGWLNLSDVYIHTAAWDGFPISVLEAAKLNKPILLRNISPFLNEGLSVSESPEEMASQIDNVLKDFDNSVAKINLDLINSEHTADKMSSSLKRIYCDD